MIARIRSIATAVPATAIPQRALAEIAVTTLGESISEAQRRSIRSVYSGTRIRSRGSSLYRPDANGEAASWFYRPARGTGDRGPTTRERMSEYLDAALDMATRASSDALRDAGVDRKSVTHIVTASCTGFAAPGLDILLVRGLGLDPGVSRTHIGFMGCHGALNALATARAIAMSDPHAVVLLCAAEVCSVHFSYQDEPEKHVANALFADGAGACVIGADQEPGREAGWSVAALRSLLVEGTDGLMSWRIGDNGFEMHLAKEVPDIIRSRLRAWLESFLAEHGLGPGEVTGWAVHPGGPRILWAVEEALDLDPRALDASRAVLAEHGNMSSPTVLFILDRLARSGARGPCVALAFGPGLSMEAALLSRD